MASAQDQEEIVTVAVDPSAWWRVTVLISFAAVVVTVLVYLISGGGKDVFTRRVTIRTFVADGTGLAPNSLVEVDGIKVGRIESVELSHSGVPSRIVLIKLAIDNKFLSSIPVDSKAEITADNLLGDKYVNIRKGIARDSVKPDDELLPQAATNNFNPADLVATLQDVLNQASSILDLIDDPQSELGQLVQGDALYNQILSEVAAVEAAVHKVGNPKSPAGQAIFGSQLYDSIRQPFLNIDQRLEAIENGEGALGHAYASSEDYDRWRGQIAEFRKSVAEWKRNPLLTSDEKYAQFLKTVKQLNAVISSTAAGPLFTGSKLYESANLTSKSLEKLMREFREDPQKFLRYKVF